ncbi:MAG: TlyA family RNA methyltransferase [Actinomycetota bacterium]
MPRRRLDSELVRRGLVPTETHARAAVRSGLVSVGGFPATNAETLVGADAPVRLLGPPRPYVSRAGGKLAAALERFAIDPAGLVCLDAGASTGGFTDCLLQAGAASVLAVDVGYGQLAWQLRNDPRVEVRERTNVRDLRPQDVQPAPQLVVADLSFISLRSVVGGLISLAAPAAGFVLLVKPQFEAATGEVETGGVVRDREVWHRVLGEVVATARTEGMGILGLMASPLRGPAGNVEFLLWGRRGAQDDRAEIDAAITEGEALA